MASANDGHLGPDSGTASTDLPSASAVETASQNQRRASVLIANRGTWSIVFAVLIGILTVWVGTNGENPNRFATSLLQAITLVFGTYGSFTLGKDFYREAGEAVVKPHAKSAFRRVLTLYQALGRLKRVAEAESEYLRSQAKWETGGSVLKLDLALASLDKIRLMSAEQIATADDALNDWQDLAPEEVSKVLAAAQRAEYASPDESEITT